MTVQVPADATRLLLVEGSDEKEFFIQLGKQLFDEPLFYIMEYEGADNLDNFLLPLPLDPRFRQLKHIGIVRDADFGINALERVRTALTHANAENSTGLHYPIPVNALEVAGSELKLSILILPDANHEGMLESVIIEALGTDKIMSCADGYFVCLENADIDAKPEPLPKATLRVYMAALYQAKMRTFIEGKNVDVEATGDDRSKSYLSDIYKMSWWPWNHPAFDNIKSFLRQLAQ